jgi:hypothetical protein
VLSRICGVILAPHTLVSVYVESLCVRVYCLVQNLL